MITEMKVDLYISPFQLMLHYKDFIWVLSYHLPKLYITNREEAKFGVLSLPSNLQINGSLFLRETKTILPHLHDALFCRCVETWKLKKNHIT